MTSPLRTISDNLSDNLGRSHLCGDRHVEPLGEGADERDGQLGLVEEEGSVPPLPSDPLRAPKVDVHRVDVRLHEPARGEENRRVVPCELCHQWPVDPVRLGIEGVRTVGRRLHHQPRVKHGCVGELHAK